MSGKTLEDIFRENPDATADLLHFGIAKMQLETEKYREALSKLANGHTDISVCLDLHMGSCGQWGYCDACKIAIDLAKLKKLEVMYGVLDK